MVNNSADHKGDSLYKVRPLLTILKKSLGSSWNAEAKLHSTNQVLPAALAMEENSSSIITRSPVVSITLDSIVSVKLTTTTVFGSRCTQEPIVTVGTVS